MAEGRDRHGLSPRLNTNATFKRGARPKKPRKVRTRLRVVMRFSAVNIRYE
jgi:hypothetical protein